MPLPLRTIIALSLTLLLGPGVGHLYLRAFKRGGAFILTALFFAVLMAFHAVKVGAGPVTSAGAAQLLQGFSEGHPRAMFAYNLIFAALWAFAVVDAFFLSGDAGGQGTDQPRSHDENV